MTDAHDRGAAAIARIGERDNTMSGTVAAASKIVVAMRGVRFAWPGRNRFSLSIDTFNLARGEKLLLIGPSGSGKSTFLSLLAGIVIADAGTVDVLGTDIGRLEGGARDRFRAEHFGIIFQQFNLLPYASVIDNVLLPLSFSKTRLERATAGGTAAAEAGRLLQRLGLEKSLIEGIRASNLSVGQQQRVAAARALIGAPELVVADEPTSSLDRPHQQAFLDLLFADLERAGASLIMVSHDETLAPRFTRTVRLDSFAHVVRGDAS